MANKGIEVTKIHFVFSDRCNSFDGGAKDFKCAALRKWDRCGARSG